MARVRKTTKHVDSSNAIDSTSGVGVSFEFGLSRVTSLELDEFAKVGWFPYDLARPFLREVVLDPCSDEVVVYKKFFIVGLSFFGTSSCAWCSQKVQSQVSSIESF